ncbi:DNA polymerase IV [Patescibacteria group bacterium]|nr:DNA polymerase IV [Patescibacteria group bacterium]
MRNKIVLHVDMDYFFAQIEERENPRFRGKPVVAGADPKGGRGRGVVSTCNYEARKYGIGSAMPISKAFQLCPEAIFLPVNHELYENTSRSIMEIVKKYSKIWKIVSLDEAYLDLSFLRNFKKAENLAKRLKREIFKKEKLTSTIGIGPNKLIAKIVSGEAKPNGLLVIEPAGVQKFLDPLNIEKIPGIGPKSAEILRNLGVKIIKDLRKLKKSKLKEIFGKVGEDIAEKARGIDESEVSSEEIVKSIGKEHTFEKDTREPEIIFSTFEKIIKNVWQEIQEEHFSIQGVNVICRFQGFETKSKQKSFLPIEPKLEFLEKTAKKLLLELLLKNQKLVRLIGLRVKVE